MLVLTSRFSEPEVEWKRAGCQNATPEKVLRNKHRTLIELLGLCSSLWLYDGKYERQTRILITGGASYCHLSKQPKTLRLHRILQVKKVQMMHLACHYLETFPFFEKASSRSFDPHSELSYCALKRKQMFEIYEVSFSLD